MLIRGDWTRIGKGRVGGDGGRSQVAPVGSRTLSLSRGIGGGGVSLQVARKVNLEIERGSLIKNNFVCFLRVKICRLKILNDKVFTGMKYLMGG
jgi:hypothetical protein